MSNYLIELSVIHLALILGYWFFLRKERQYAKMRFFLLASTLLALVIPLLKLPKLFFSSEESIAVPIDAIPLYVTISTPPTAQTPTWSDLFIWVYISINIFFLLKFLYALLYLFWLERNSNREKFNGLRIRKVKGINGSFTFFNWIFISDEFDENEQGYAVILKHEKAHATLGHTWDVMFFELFKVCFWWLPTAWFISKEIREIHEYQADAHALKSCNFDQYSFTLVSSILKLNGVSLASSFHDNLILKRLIAMKQQARNVSPWKLGALSALGALLFTVFACSEEPNKNTQEIDSQSNQLEKEVFRVVEAQPEFEGGLDGFYKYVLNEIRYPLQARQMGVEGGVDVQFVVEKDGSVSDVKALKGIGAGCDSEAVRVIQNAPSFKPGTQNGKPVRVRMVVPIIFKLNQGKTNSDNSTQGMIVLGKIESKNEKFKVEAGYNDGEWSGTVLDEEGNGLPGATIMVVGTTRGTISDMDGKFKLEADGPKEINISFIGYESMRLKGK